jgi:hypothetical protein
MAELRAGAGMEGPLRANLHEWGPFQIEVSMTDADFLRHGPQSLFAE